MTERLPPNELKSSTRRMGDLVRSLFGCPFCLLHNGGALMFMAGVSKLRVIKWRKTAVRVECPSCGMRFSIERASIKGAISSNGNAGQIADAIWDPTLIDRLRAAGVEVDRRLEATLQVVQRRP